MIRHKHDILPRFVAHRGAVTKRSENTKEAFDYAYAMKSDFEKIGSSVSLEFDVRLTKDKTPVCIHDPDTKRVTGTDCTVADITFAQMQQLDFGIQHPEHSATLITLEQMFMYYPDVVFDLEIKEKHQRGMALADIVCHTIKKYNASDKIILHIPCVSVSQYAMKIMPQGVYFEVPSSLIDTFTHAVIQGDTVPFYQGYQQMSLTFFQKDVKNPAITHYHTDQKYVDASRAVGYPLFTYWQYQEQGDHTQKTVQDAINTGADSLILDDIHMALKVFTEHAKQLG